MTALFAATPRSVGAEREKSVGVAAAQFGKTLRERAEDGVAARANGAGRLAVVVEAVQRIIVAEMPVELVDNDLRPAASPEYSQAPRPVHHAVTRDT
jgi:hypothetical protein